MLSIDFTYTARFSSQDERPTDRQKTREDPQHSPKEERGEMHNKEQFQKQRATCRIDTSSRNHELEKVQAIHTPRKIF